MKSVFTAALFVIFVSGNANANEVYSSIVNANAGAFDVKEVRIRHLETFQGDQTLDVFLDYENDCSPMGRVGNTTRSLEGTGAEELLGDVSLDTIINLGKQVWTFIENNKPVVTAKTQNANALPSGLKCWTDLENWQAPRSEVYEAVYINGFKMEVVKLRFAVVYAFGGQVNGKGQYVANATIQYRKLDVAWGFKVNADVAVPLVLNVGTKDAPVAGLQISLHWTVRGLNHIERTASFFLAGDGRATQVLE